MVRIFMNQTLGLPKREVYLFVGDGHCPPTSDGPVINCPTSETIQILLVQGFLHYGNTGYGVFKGRIKKQKGFWLKINCNQMKLPNSDQWSNDELSKIGHHFRK